MMELIITTEKQLREIIASEIQKHNAQAPALAQAPTIKDAYTSKELQALFNISTTTVWTYERKGILKPVILNRKKTYLGADIAALIESKQLNKRG